MQTQFSAPVVISIYLFGLIGCGDLRSNSPSNPHENLSKRALAAMEELGNTCASIKDVKSAQVAMPKLELLRARMKEIAEESRKLGNPPPELRAKLDAKMKEQMVRTQAKFDEFAKNVKLNPRIVETLGPAMSRIPSIQ